MLQSDILFIIKWWGVLFVIGLTCLPLTSKVFNSFIDKGYIFSKIIGVVIISYSIYVLASFHLLKFSVNNILLVAFLWLIVNLLLIYKKPFFKSFNFKLLFFEEILFLSTLFLWSYIRSFSPDVNGLEKFMDFGFINSILRADYFPPKDMWLTPFSINYYYFGHLITAVLTKLSLMPSYITFNLMLAGVFAFTFSASFSIGINLINKLGIFSVRKNILIGLIIGYAVSFSGNLQTIYSLFKPGENSEHTIPFWKLIFSPQTFPNSYWYPAATRFIYHTIHEFPSYSFVVADLHGHVLSIPIVLTLIALALSLYLENKIKILPIILSSFLIAIAYMTNAWDGLIYLGLFANVLFLISFLQNNKKGFLERIFYSTKNSGKFIILILLGFFIFSFTFNQSFSPFASGIGVNCSPDFLIKLDKIGPLLFEEGQCEHSPIWQLFILYGFFIFMIISFMFYLRKKKMLASDGFILLISFFSIFLIVVPEIFYLKDIYSSYFRANTMFKLSYQAFIMLSFASIYIFVRIISDFKKNFREVRLKIPLIIFLVFAFLLLFIVSAYPYFAIPSGYGGLKEYKNLNGVKYLEETKPGDYSAINWLNSNIKGQPVILEAQGDSYTDYGRVSANTGLPTVLGWSVHEWLWRGSYDVPSSRLDPIKTLYETDEEYTAKNIIDKYNIEYIYIGGLEREKYKVSDKKFFKIGRIVYSNPEVRIFKMY